MRGCCWNKGIGGGGGGASCGGNATGAAADDDAAAVASFVFVVVVSSVAVVAAVVVGAAATASSIHIHPFPSTWLLLLLSHNKACASAVVDKNSMTRSIHNLCTMIMYEFEGNNIR